MPRTTARRGAILLIVLVLLALFAVVGISFVLFAQSEATTAGIQKEGIASVRDTHPDPAPAMVEFLRQLVYSTPPSMGMAHDGGIKSALHGHDLARTMYGFHPNGIPTLADGNPNPLFDPRFTNWVPYSGIGIFNEAFSHMPPGANTRLEVINHSALTVNDPIVEPEFAEAPRIAIDAFDPLNPLPPTAVYVGKNAPYTYPDLNNVAIGMMDPASGRIVQPSFHRPALFGPLDPSNPNWFSPAGRYRILRPRPVDHVFDSGDGRGPVSDFPFPPANPDGTITGDVQNMRWSNGVQSNDSVWLHCDLPNARFRNRIVQPLIAPLIIPLDGRVNLQVAGNRRGLGGTHGSHMGFGPWEINPAAVMVQPQPGLPPTMNGQAEAPAIVSHRYGDPSLLQPVSAAFASASVNHAFDSSSPNPIIEKTLMDYSAINWQAGPAQPLPTPITTTFQTEPVFPVQGWENNRGTGMMHQSIYNPYLLLESPAPGGRKLRFDDFRQLAYRYSTSGRMYTPPLYGNPLSDTSFSGDGPNHPSRLARANTTIVSNSLARGGMSPSFAAITPGSYIMPPAAGMQTVPPVPLSTPIPFTPVPPQLNSDNIPGLGGYRSTAAALGPVDLNRPLTSYRADVTTPLSSPANVASAPSQAMFAHRDRHQLAKDIFDRLVLATGAPYDQLINGRPVGFTQAQASPPALNALRYLAQLSVNIVDFIDEDDVCTAFVWNPIDPSNPMPEQDATNYTDLANRIVFGVEKPRLVINEVYSEITNDPLDAAQPSARNNFQVRFFIEVVNPLNNPVPRGAANPAMEASMGDGSAMLRIGSQSVYRFQIYSNGDAVRNDLFDPNLGAANVTGTPTSVQPRLSVTMPNSAISVEPNNGQMQSQGFREFAPQASTNHNDAGVYRPTAGAQLIGVPESGGNPPNQLLYTERVALPRDIPPIINQLNPGRNGTHAVLLQRLANPYLPEGPNNPYLTVDAMWDIRVNDAIDVGQEEPRPPLPPLPGTRQAGQERTPLEQRASLARRAPLYAHRGMQPQSSYSLEAPMSGPLAQRMRSHNTHVNPPLLQPFEWLIHFDRKLVNPMELLHVAAVKPHELLHYFVSSPTGRTDPLVQPNQKHHHTAPWGNPQANLYRALELLRVKPWMYNVPLGGREPGRINVNSLWSPEVLNAVLDPQAGNGFNLGEVNTLWNTLFTTSPGARTPNLNNVAPSDRPIQMFGAATQNVLNPTLPGMDDTLFRTVGPRPAFQLDPNQPQHAHPFQQWEMLRKAVNNLSTTSDTFLVIFTIGYFEVRSPADPFGSGRLVPVLGREAFDEIPGDLRVRYAAVVDRSMLGISPLPHVAGTPMRQANNVFYTELSSEVDPLLNPSQPVSLQIRCTGGGIDPTQGPYLEIEYEGRLIRLRTPPPSGTLAGNEVVALVIGTGADAQFVTLDANVTITPPLGNSGIGTITFPVGQFRPQVPGGVRDPVSGVVGPALAPLRKMHIGEAVSSVIPGNPGPQIGFDYNLPMYQQVIRDLQRIDP